MSGSLNKKQQQRCKVEEVAGSSAVDIEDEINNKLVEGWTVNTIFAKGNKTYIVFIK